MPAAPNTVACKPVGPVGFGLMSLTRFWAPLDRSDAIRTMKTALDRGANFWNGGLHYGTPTNNSLHLLRDYFELYPEDASKVVLSIKGAFDVQTRTPSGSPDAIRASVEDAVRILSGAKKIDIFECARVDPNVPIETSVKALAELVAEGKIGGVGLTEVSAATIRRAHAVHPISAVEIELSLFSTDVLENGVADTCHELGIPLIAYSPLSRGFLSGQFQQYSDLPENDLRRMLPRFQPDVFDDNLKLTRAVEKIAKRKGATVGQTALEWVKRQGAIPIPGTVSVDRVLENCTAVDLTEDDLAEIKEILNSLLIKGERYGGQQEKYLNQ